MAELNPCVTFAKIIKKDRQACMKSVAEYSLAPNEIDVLLYLSNNPSFNTAKDICKYRGISKSLVCHSVDSLCSRGFLSIKEDPEDRRILRLTLSESSAPVLAKLKKARQQFQASLYQGLSKEEIKAFQSVLESMIKNALSE